MPANAKWIVIPVTIDPKRSDEKETRFTPNVAGALAFDTLQEALVIQQKVDFSSVVGTLMIANETLVQPKGSDLFVPGARLPTILRFPGGIPKEGGG